MAEEKIQRLEINFMELNTNVKNILKTLENNVDEHKEIIDKLDGFIQSSTDRFVDKKYHKETMDEIGKILCSADNKYSSKWVEKVILWGAGIIGTFMLIGLLTLIVKAFLTLNK